MSKHPAGWLSAIEQVNERVLCLSDCYSTVSVSYVAASDLVLIRHPDRACEAVRHPDGAEATALAEFVIEELSRYVAMADYGEPLPVNIGCDA